MRSLATLTIASMAGLGFGALCRLGFALTWPLAAVALIAVLAVVLARIR